MRRPSRITAGSAAVLLGAGLLLAGCGSDDKAADDTTTTVAESTTTAAEATTTAPSGELTVDGAWARTSPAMASRGAVYLSITNGTDTDDALTGAAVDPSVAAVVEVHETVSDAGDGDMSSTTGMGGGGGMMSMRPVEKIPVPAGETVNLQPGGYHIMLMDLAAPLEVGSTIEVTLTFENAGDVKVEAEVRDSAP